ncbi:hypothetical protein [Dyella sp.]|jgi:hypothetical protein|uniref:hypothetical protein n=1 Tax=Dyella sp. TaxID=1869338 RepID=UPI002FDB09EA
MRILGALVVAILICATHNANAATIADADNLEQAASMVLAAAKIIDADMDTCARANPSQSFIYRMAAFMWQGDNREMVVAAQNIRQKMVVSDLAIRGGDVIVKNAIAAYALAVQLDRNTCIQSATDVFSGRSYVKNQTPRAYAFLIATYSPSPRMALDQDKSDATVGCMKAYSNRGLRDFDRGLTFCQCNTEAMFSHMTEAQRQELHKSTPLEVEKLPWMQSVIRERAQCVRILQG